MSNKWWWDSDYDFHGTKKYDELGSEYPKKEINIARIGLISNRLTEDTHFIEGLDEFYSILKINDHTGSIKLETRPCPCSEERIESERHVNRTNELLHMANKKKNTWVLEKWKEREKKKKNRNCRRSNDCSNVGLNGLLMEFSSGSIAGWCSPFSVPILDAPLFSQIFIFAAISCGQYGRDSVLLCFCADESNYAEDSRRRNNNKRFSLLRTFCSFVPLQEQFGKRFLRNSMDSLLLILKKIRTISLQVKVAIFSKNAK